MFDITLSEEFRMTTEGTSEGTQDKFYYCDYWYKQNSMGDEASAEVIASTILSCSSLDESEYVVYEDGMLNDKRACKSKDFLKEGESFYTLYRIYQLLESKKINEVTRMMSVDERVEYVVSYFKEKINLDLTEYFRKTFTLDLITLNEDRHYNNLGVIRTEDGTYKEAPIFDNGKTFFIGNYSINRYLSFEENRERIIAKPFSNNPDKQAALFGLGFQINFEELARRMDLLNETIQQSDVYEIAMKNIEYVKYQYPELCMHLLTREEKEHISNSRNRIPNFVSKIPDEKDLIEVDYLAQTKAKNANPSNKTDDDDQDDKMNDAVEEQVVEESNDIDEPTPGEE